MMPELWPTITVGWNIVSKAEQLRRYHEYCLKQAEKDLLNCIGYRDCTEIVEAITHHENNIKHLKRLKYGGIGSDTRDERLLCYDKDKNYVNT